MDLGEIKYQTAHILVSPCKNGQADDHDLNQELLGFLEQHRAHEEEEMIQKTMNWCAAQIGIADDKLRSRCVRLGETLGLYKDYPASKGCTSLYLPIWIESVVGKKRKPRWKLTEPEEEPRKVAVACRLNQPQI
jgi:3-methyladenine DNA glycosylase AlkD